VLRIVTIIVAVAFLIGVGCFVFQRIEQGERSAEEFRLSEARYQAERRARHQSAADRRLREIAATSLESGWKRTPIGEGSVAVPQPVKNSGFWNGASVSASLNWPDRYRLEYSTASRSVKMVDAKSETLPDGSVVRYGAEGPGGDMLFELASVNIRLRHATPASVERALKTLRTFRTGVCPECEEPSIYTVSRTPLGATPKKSARKSSH
jgi:hypothetical protein